MNITNVERSIIIFLSGLIVNVVLTLLFHLIPLHFQFRSFSFVSPVGAKTIDAHVSEKLVNISSAISFTPSSQTTTIPIKVTSYVLIDTDSKTILAEQQMNQQVSIASVTKIMTAIVALDLANPDDRFTVTTHASKIIPTKIGVVPGQQMNLKELLYALLLTSANDAAEVIKEGVNEKYGADVFVKAMNTKAMLLGLEHTHFQNPQGFDHETHYSSAYDLAVLATYAMDNYPLFKEIVNKPYAYLPANGFHKQFDLQNWNGLLAVYPGVNGVKIGNTEQAGKTTVVTSTREGKTLLAVVLGSETVFDRDEGTVALLNYGFSLTKQLPPVAIDRSDLQKKYESWQTYPRNFTVQ